MTDKATDDISIESMMLIGMEEEAIYEFGKRKITGYDYFLSQEVIVQRSRQEINENSDSCINYDTNVTVRWPISK